MKLFIEGGGDAKSARADFQKGFRSLVEQVASKMPRIVACGPRGDAFDKFRSALARGENALLLVDSEAQVSSRNFGRPWLHLRERDGWQKPQGADDDHVHLMAQCMESWFIADTDALRNHFGRGFKPAKLPRNSDVEEIAKSDVMSGLESAAKETRKGEYHKTRDGFALIGIIDPSRVAERAPHAKRFFDALRQKLGAKQDE